MNNTVTHERLYMDLILYLIDQVPSNADVCSRLKVGNNLPPNIEVIINASSEFMLDPDDSRYIIKTSDYRKTLAHREKLKKQQEEDRLFHNTAREYFHELEKAGIPRPIIDALMVMGSKKSLTDLREVIDKLIPPSK